MDFDFTPYLEKYEKLVTASDEAFNRVKNAHADCVTCAAGCADCVAACNTENGLDAKPTPTSSQWIRKVEIKEIKTGRTASLPVMCQHCAEPPCVDVCPTGASFKRADGLVLVDRHICIGCRYCMMACPYKARSFVHEPVTGQSPDVPRGKGCVESCTLCVHRIDRDRITGVILAGGRSTRMGANKALLEVGGLGMLRRTAELVGKKILPHGVQRWVLNRFYRA